MDTNIIVALIGAVATVLAAVLVALIQRPRRVATHATISLEFGMGGKTLK